MPIAREAARHIAVQAYLRHGGLESDTVMIEMGDSAGLENMYVFVSVGGRGFVVVAADDCVRTVLAVSIDGEFALPLPDNVRGWLEGYDHQIGYWKSVSRKKAAKSGERPATSVGNGTYWSIGPLLETKWNQSPYYNEMCPTRNGRHCVAGCVATAMAQIIRYWSYPPQGIGNHSYYLNNIGSVSADFSTNYDWNHMPAMLSRASSQEEIDAVALLSFHCGVSVEMNYDTTQSSAFSSDVAPALTYNFNYSNNAILKYKSDYTDTRWKQMLCDEIDAGRPIFYSGSGEGGGHAFVCDGYDSDGSFHFNWGWGGMYNGFFAMGNLHPSGGGTGSNNDNNFSNENRAIIGIEPPSSGLLAHATTRELSGWGDSAAIWVRGSNQSNDDWAAVSDAPWLTISPTSGSGGGRLGMVSVHAEHNTTGSTRTATVTISHNGIQRTITFTQEDRTPSPDSTYGNANTQSRRFINLEAGSRLILRPEALGNFTSRQQVTAIDFHIVNDSWQFEIEIYEGSSLNTDLTTHGASYQVATCLGTRVYSQNHTAQLGQQQHVILDNPYNIPANRNFWIVLHCLDTAKFFFDYDTLPTPLPTATVPLIDSLTQHYLSTQSYLTDTIIRQLYSAGPIDSITNTRIQYSVEPHFTFTVITPPCGDNHHTDTITSCTPYTWWGRTYASSGHYTMTRQGVAQFGCDSTYELFLETSHYDTTQRSDCENVSIGGQTYTYDTMVCSTQLQTRAGCDSMEYVEIHIIGTIRTEQDSNGCDRVAWNGHNYTTDTAMVQSYMSITTGCDSLHTTHLHVITSPHRSVDTSGCAPFSWQGATTMRDTTITKVLRSEGRCDSTVVMHITITTNRIGIHDTNVCDSIRWNGQTYRQNVVLPYRTIALGGGCDSVISLRAKVHQSASGTPITSNVCDELVLEGRRYTTSGTYTQRVGTAANGCDSVSILRLTVRHSGRKDTYASACDSFIWYGSMLITSGVFDQPLRVRNHQGCDSIEYMHLTLYRSGIYHIYDTACESLSWHRRTARADTTMNARLRSSHGCDSTVYMHITIHHATSGIDFPLVCDTLTWLGSHYTKDSVIQSSELRNRWGCDSNVTLYLHVLRSTVSDTVAWSCDSAFRWHGQWYDSTGIYSRYVTYNSTGCDSSVRLNLTIGHSSEEYEQAEADSAYMWHGRLLEVSGEYSDTLTDEKGCDSIVHLTLTLQQTAAVGIVPQTIKVFAIGRTIVVQGAEGMSVSLHNLQGIALHHIAKAPSECRLPVGTKGIFIVSIASANSSGSYKVVAW